MAAGFNGLTPRPRMLAVMLLLAAWLGGCAAPTSTPPRTLAVSIGPRKFNLELALDNASRMQGLSDRKAIAANGGMLFVFTEPGEQIFVMRRCYVPIDLIYLGPGGQVVSMHRMTVVPYDTPEEDLPPYPSNWPAQFAIEIKGGTLDQLGLKLGQKIDLPLDSLKRWAR